MASRRSLTVETLRLIELEAARGNVRGSLAVALRLLICMLILAWWGVEVGAYGSAAAIAVLAPTIVIWRYFIERAAMASAQEPDWLGLFVQFRWTTILSASLWVIAALAIFPYLDATQRVVYLIGVSLALATTAVHFAGHPAIATTYVATLLGALVYATKETVKFDPLAIVFLLCCVTVWARLFIAGTSRTADLASRMSRSLAARRLWADRAQRRIRAAEVRAEQAKRRAAESRALFVARASHELRTPLQNIISGLELLQQRMASGTVDQKNQALLERLSKSTDQVLMLSHDLADFVRWESGTLPVRLTAVDVPDLMDDIAAGLAERARLRGVRLSVERAGPQGANQTDAARLRAIVTNLLTNAIKHAPSGSVCLATERDGHGSVVITVQDTGPGLPERVMQVLSRPWVPGDSTRVQEEGFGLGLSIVMSLSQEIGALVTVETSSRGTTLKIEIPKTPPV